MPRKYAKILFWISIALLLLIPFLWLIESGQVQKFFPWLSSAVVRLVGSKKIKTDLPDYQAEIVNQSHQNLRFKSGEEIQIWIEFKNVGKKTWENFGKNFVSLKTADPKGRQSPFYSPAWDKDYDREPTRVNRIDQKEVRPGEIARVRLTLRGPQKAGQYHETFQLFSEGKNEIKNSKFSIPIVIDLPKIAKIPQKKGPLIKVGLFEIEKQPVQISGSGEFEIRGDQNDLLALYNFGEIVQVHYKDGQYYLTAPAQISGKKDPRGWKKMVSSKNIWFVPKYDTILQIVNFENRPHWNPALNDNQYRGKLVIWHSQKTDKTWVINELPLELYLRGVAETSDFAPHAWQKALAVAERTYAQYLINIGGKHRDDNFIIDASPFDQVYKGYAFELRSPRVTEAVVLTCGEMVTYKDRVVVTPYFSQSDGRTRAWSEVFSGNKPWLQSVPDPACKGKKLLGHGVGMSGLGAINLAESGKSYRQILKYYYRGIKIKKFY